MMSNDRDVRMLQMEEDQTLQVQKKTKKIYTKEIKASIYKLMGKESLYGMYGLEPIHGSKKRKHLCNSVKKNGFRKALDYHQ